MPDIETLLAELFGFQQFERDEALQRLIDDTLERYGDAGLSADDLDAAAGGTRASDREGEGSDDPCTLL